VPLEADRTKPLRRPVLFINPRSGGGAPVRARIGEHARERGIATVVLEPGQSLADLVRRAVDDGADALGMAGGDGSLATVATIACGAGLAFVCVPAGTRNHFARDLGLDHRDPAAALDAFTDGDERRVDVGVANGRMFLNNVSLGLYGDAVRRAEYRDAKARTILETAREVVGPSATTSGLRVVDDRGREHVDSAIVLISNNPYALNHPGRRGTRAALDGGRLGVLVVDAPVPPRPPTAHAWTAEALTVAGPSRVHAGFDGEPVELAPPLRFAIRPAALRVRVAAQPGPPSPPLRRPRARRPRPSAATTSGDSDAPATVPATTSPG